MNAKKRVALKEREKIRRLSWIVDKFIEEKDDKVTREPEVLRTLFEHLFLDISHNENKWEKYHYVSYNKINGVHNGLKLLWSEFKYRMPPLLKGNRNIWWKPLARELKEIGSFHLIFDVSSGRVNIEDDGPFQALVNFLFLLNDLPCDIFCECADEKCDRWFIQTYGGKKKKRIFCSNKCASRSNQAKQRERRKQDKQSDKKYRMARSEKYYERNKDEKGG